MLLYFLCVIWVMKAQLFFVLFLIVCAVLVYFFFTGMQKGVEEYEPACVGYNQTWTANAFGEPNCCQGLVAVPTIETRTFGKCLHAGEQP